MLSIGDSVLSAWKRWSDVKAFAANESPLLPRLPPAWAMPFKLVTNADLDPDYLLKRREQLEAYMRAVLPSATDRLVCFLQPAPTGPTKEPAEAAGAPGSPSAAPLTGSLASRASRVARLTPGQKLRFSPHTLGTPPSHIPLVPPTRNERRRRAAIRLQATARGWRTRQLVDRALAIWYRCAAAQLQGSVRAFLVRRRPITAAATRLQAKARMRLARGRVRAVLHMWFDCAATHLQRVLRGCVVRRRNARSAAAAAFQTSVRGIGFRPSERAYPGASVEAILGLLISSADTPAPAVRELPGTGTDATMPAGSACPPAEMSLDSLFPAGNGAW